MWPPPKPQADTEIRWLRALLAPTEDPGPPAWTPPTGPLRERFRSWFAAIGRREGCWLEGAVTPANAHTSTGAALLRLQAALETAVAQRRLAFAGCPAPVPEPLRADLAWLTALARWGEAFLPEILGITLAHVRLAGGLFSFVPIERDALQAVEEAVSACLTESNPDPDRLAAGIAFYHRRSRAWLAAWEALAADPRRQVLALLREKARFGLGYHARIELEGRPLDDWLAELPSDTGEAFLDALRKAPWRDRLLKALAFGGPMFGVFDRTERALLERWLSGEKARPNRRRPVVLAEPLPLPPAVEQESARRLNCPQLYHRLLHAQRFPACLPAARALAAKVLARAESKPPFAYTEEALRRWVETLHARANRLEPAPPRPWLSKAACRFGIEQLAPAILVDGSWLARSPTLARLHPPLGRALWRIFRDEVGDGDPGRNHANVYRKLLEQAGIELPPFDSEAFIHHPGFIPGAFDLPAFLLAIGQFSEDFLPELLGLNLAIELSGLGRTYQRLIFALESHGLDATIVRLHQAIDNLAAGHAALARDAIIAHLETLALGGEETVQRQWRRIFTGYRAFAVVTRRFAFAFLIAWGLLRLKEWRS
ncbi:hypothetical protein JCM13664_10430 [Methylothermus subterraneus]